MFVNQFNTDWFSDEEVCFQQHVNWYTFAQATNLNEKLQMFKVRLSRVGFAVVIQIPVILLV